jgi:Cdc6-like AAA superfamily ATPase
MFSHLGSKGAIIGMDYAKLANPYDFANPVMDADLFVGRTKEMNDISYYLDHASRAARAINLAIMGERASGKTSVLNKIQCLAQERAFCVVRIDLDEGDARTQMGFFYKIFDSLLTTVCSNGTYGGLVAKTYQMYRNMVDAFEIPEDKTFCPFIFPFQYANASRRENETATLSEVLRRIFVKSIES